MTKPRKHYNTRTKPPIKTAEKSLFNDKQKDDTANILVGLLISAIITIVAGFAGYSTISTIEIIALIITTVILYLSLIFLRRNK